MTQFHKLWSLLGIGLLVLGTLMIGACRSQPREHVPDLPLSQLRPELGHQRVIFREDTIGIDHFYVVRVDGSQFITLTSTLGIPRRAALSSDGSQVVYECDNDLCLMTIDGETQKRLVDVSEQIPGMMSANAPAFSSDGQRIVFTGSFSNAIELFVVSIDGTGLKQISDGVYSHYASYSPDGTQIVFKCEGNKTVPSQICLMNADGAEKTLLTDTDLAFWEPKFTPDGQHIVVSAYKDSFVLGLFGHTDPSRLYVMNTDGSDFRQLVSGEETFAVAFSTDGQEVVYQTYDKDTGESEGIYVINIDGSNKRRLGDDWWDIARRGGGLAE